MDMQKDLIQKIRKKYDNPTYKELSALTGIQLTRVFRVFNGYEMKLTEYMKLNALVEQREAHFNSLEATVKKCRYKLSDERLSQLNNYCQRQLEIVSIIKDMKNVEIA